MTCTSRSIDNAYGCIFTFLTQSITRINLVTGPTVTLQTVTLAKGTNLHGNQNNFASNGCNTNTEWPFPITISVPLAGSTIVCDIGIACTIDLSTYTIAACTSGIFPTMTISLSSTGTILADGSSTFVD